MARCHPVPFRRLALRLAGWHLGVLGLSLLLSVSALLGSARASSAVNLQSLHELQRRAELEPDEVRWRVDLSHAALAFGLVDESRRQARRAVAIAPDRFAAQRALGDALAHGPAGRLFGPGFDRAGAIEALRRAVALDGSQVELWAELAHAYEHDEQGRRYEDPEGLAEAITIYQGLAADQGQPTHQLGENPLEAELLQALLHAERNQEVVDRLADTTGRHVDLLAAAEALTVSPEDAVRRVLESFPGDPVARGQALVGAGSSLFDRRHYPQAAIFFRAASSTPPSPPQLQFLARMTERTKRWEEVSPGAGTPEALFSRVFRAILTAGPQFMKALQPVMADPWRHGPMKESLLTLGDQASGFDAADLQFIQGSKADQLLDIVLSAARASVEELPGTGWQLRFQSELIPNSKTDQLGLLAVRENGQLRIVAFEDDWNTLGRYALELARTGNPETARAWLDLAAERIDGSEGWEDDALGEILFDRLWQRDDTAVETAAAVLAARGLAGEEVLGILRQARADAPDDEVAQILDRALAIALLTTDGDPADLLELGQRIERSMGDDRDDRFVLAALDRLERYDEILARYDAALEESPNDLEIAGQRAELLARMGKLDEAARAYQDLVDRPGTSAVRVGQAAWLAVVRGTIDERSRRWAESAVLSSAELPDPDLALRALAVIYTENGRFKKAHQVMLQAIEARRDRRPRPDDWFVFGAIAEDLGFRDAAREYYERIEPPVDRSPVPTDPWSVAQRRLVALDRAADQAGGDPPESAASEVGGLHGTAR